MSHAAALMAILDARHAKVLRIKRKRDRRIAALDRAIAEVERSTRLLAEADVALALARAAADSSRLPLTGMIGLCKRDQTRR